MMCISIARKKKASLLGYPDHFHRILLLLFPSYREENLSIGVVIRAHETEAVHNFVIQKKKYYPTFST